LKISAEGFGIEDYPQLEAIREALVNMLMHADYFSTAKARIRIFDNRIEFWNPGSPPKSIEELISGDITIPRNPIIAKLFRVVKLSENAGYGFEKMITGWNSYAKNAPEFSKDIDSTTAVFNFPEELIIIREFESKVELEQERVGDTSEKTSEKILELIRKNNKITIKKLSGILEITERAVEMQISKLKKDNRLKRIGSAKGGHWEVV
jgi:ATP-dependent DNA helicase RecG